MAMGSVHIQSLAQTTPVTAPADGAFWTVGTPCHIQWSAANLTRPVDWLFHSTGGVSWYRFATAVANNGA